MTAGDSAEVLLDVRGLELVFATEGSPAKVLRGVSFTIDRGEFVGFVGESGSGKSLSALAVLGLIPPGGQLQAGSVRWRGRELVGLPEGELRSVRGGEIALVPQEPMAAFNPVYTIGHQLVEAVRLHRSYSVAEAEDRAVELLEQVAVPAARTRMKDYPHQLSGGQRQRALIAMALAAEPELLIADEPTTALDVTLQAQILDLLADLREQLGLAVLLITHDLGVVAQTCDRVLVLYAGQVVEEGQAVDVFSAPKHPYTRGLLAAVPKLGERAPEGVLPTIRGQVPTPEAMPPGCAFHPRCDEARSECEAEEPGTFDSAGHRVRCVLHDPRGGP